MNDQNIFLTQIVKMLLNGSRLKATQRAAILLEYIIRGPFSCQHFYSRFCHTARIFQSMLLLIIILTVVFPM